MVQYKMGCPAVMNQELFFISPTRLKTGLRHRDVSAISIFVKSNARGSDVQKAGLDIYIGMLYRILP